MVTALENCLNRDRAYICVKFGWLLLGAIIATALAWVPVVHAQGENTSANSGITILLPPRVMAGHPATLAVLDVNGMLAPGVSVDLGGGQIVTTDRTGRALFDAPATGEYVLGKSSGASVATLIDPAAGASEPSGTTLPPVVSVHDRFWICGAGLRGDADSNRVEINGHTALVMAASPICLIALPPPDANPGPAVVSIEAPGVRVNANTTLVSLKFVAPEPALKPGEKGQLLVRAQGASEKLRIVVRNGAPEVLRFVRGDLQELVTSGGAQNSARVAVQAIKSGSFSFVASLLSSADATSAERYLRAAVQIAPQESKREVEHLADRLERNPRDIEKVRAELDRIASRAAAGDFRALLDAARSEL